MGVYASCSRHSPTQPEEHEEYLEWAGADFDPEDFSLGVVNVHLKSLD